MKKNITLFAVMALTIPLHEQAAAQPVITSSSTLPSVGAADSILLAPASVPPGAGGAAVTWNLSGLAFTYSGSLTIVNASSTPYASTFPTSNFCMQLSGGSTVYNYDRMSAAGIETIATSYAGPGTGVDYSSNPRLGIPFPFHYLDSVADAYQPSGSAVDTVGLIYDGYGTLITPFHTYTNVVRVKENYGGTDYHYAWYTVSPLELVLNYSNTGSNYVCISTRPIPSGITEPEVGTVQATFFPNPASNESILRIHGIQSYDHVSLTITDAIGNIVREIPVTAAETLIRAEDLAPGLYFYRIRNNGQIAANGKLTIR